MLLYSIYNKIGPFFLSKMILPKKERKGYEKESKGTIALRTLCAESTIMKSAAPPYTIRQNDAASNNTIKSILQCEYMEMVRITHVVMGRRVKMLLFRLVCSHCGKRTHIFNVFFSDQVPDQFRYFAIGSFLYFSSSLISWRTEAIFGTM